VGNLNTLKASRQSQNTRDDTAGGRTWEELANKQFNEPYLVIYFG